MAGGKKRRGGLVLILIALILIIGLAAVLLLLRDQLFPGGGQAQTLNTPTPIQEMVDIIVLSQPISRGTTINETMLAKVPYPASKLVQGLFILRMEEVLGKRARYDLQASIPLTPTLLTDKTTGSLASFQIPRGMVAITLPINRLTAVSYALQPGDHVNIIASMMFVDLDNEFQSKLPNVAAPVLGPGPQTPPVEGAQGIQIPASPVTLQVQSVPGIPYPYVGRSVAEPAVPSMTGGNSYLYQIPSESQRPRLVSQALVQDAIVLWVGEFPLNDVGAQDKPTPTPVPGTEKQVTPQAPTKPEVITLVVTPQDAITLNYLMLSHADLNLTLRSAGDDQRIATESVTLQFLLEQYNIPFPSKLPYGMENNVFLKTPTPIVVPGGN